MDTHDIVLIQLELDPLFATTATVDILVLVVLTDTVRVVATGVELNIVAERVSMYLLSTCICTSFIALSIHNICTCSKCSPFNGQ